MHAAFDIGTRQGVKDVLLYRYRYDDDGVETTEEQMTTKTQLLPFRLLREDTPGSWGGVRAAKHSWWRFTCIVFLASVCACTATNTAEYDETGSESAVADSGLEGAEDAGSSAQGPGLDQKATEPVDEERVDTVVSAAGYYSVSPDEWDDYLEALMTAQGNQEELVGRCMSEHGFEYFQKELRQTAWQPDYSVERTGFEWVSTYGLGWSTTLFSTEILSRGAVGFVGPGPPPGPDISEDSPESQYLASLSTEGLHEYHLTLAGFDPSMAFALDSEGEFTLTSPEALSDEAINNSCSGRARQDAPEPLQPSGADTQLASRILASSGWIETETEGWRCVLDQGYEVESLAAAQSLANDWVVQLSDSLGPENDDIMGDSGLSQEFEEALVEVQAKERKLAKVLWDCGVHEIQQAERFRDLVVIELG